MSELERTSEHKTLELGGTLNTKYKGWERTERSIRAVMSNSNRNCTTDLYIRIPEGYVLT